MDTARERGWEGFRNGDLLNAAEENRYEVFLTCDQSIRHQQNLSHRRIGVLILLDNAWPNVRKKAAEIQELLDRMQPGEYIELEI